MTKISSPAIIHAHMLGHRERENKVKRACVKYYDDVLIGPEQQLPMSPDETAEQSGLENVCTSRCVWG